MQTFCTYTIFNFFGRAAWRRKMQAMYDTVVDCIKKPPATRTDEEAEKLVPWFVKTKPLFQALKPGEHFPASTFNHSMYE